MTIQGNLASPAAEVQRISYQPQIHAAQNAAQNGVQNTQKSENLAARRFDSVTIRGGDGRQNAYAMELRSKISQDVRTATSSGKIAELRDQIRSGAYHIDPLAIAGKMLLLGGQYG